MSGTEQDDRTEAATARRLQRAREDGNVALSTELSPLLLLGGIAGLLALGAPAALQRLQTDLAGLLYGAGRIDGPIGIGIALQAAGGYGLRALTGIFAVALVAGIAAVLGQTGFLLHAGALLPDLARLSPRRGLQRVFGAANRVQAAKSLLKGAMVGFALYHTLHGQSARLVDATLRQPGDVTREALHLVGNLLFTAIAAQALVAIVDIGLVRARHAKSLRMTRDEVRLEARESNGSPEVKARIRRLRGQRARRRMAQAVQQATVVVTNPTHYAVALAYDKTQNAAPRVVAKGVDEMAARIRAIAEEHRVPMVANPPLARALHRLELDSDIPPELYQTVAELIAYVWRLHGSARRRPA